MTGKTMAKQEKNPESEWFGYQKVDSQEKTRLVEDVFSSVASRYDLMNDLMSGGLHRLWKRKFISIIHPRAEHRLLDLAGGTGDISFHYLKRTKGEAKITVCDLNQDMLDVGQDRALDKGIIKEIDWVQGNAEKLPFEDNSFDVCTIAFGLRNVTHIDNALAEIYRVLKPGGRFFCLEFSHVVLPVLDKIYDAYSFHIIPKLGEWIAKDAESYQYLAESIRQFPKQQELVERMGNAGFKSARYRNMTGGIVAIHSGVKTAEKKKD